MGTVVDELIVVLGLDPSDFNKGQKEAVREWQKTRDEMVKRSKEMEEQGKHLNEQISTLTTRFTALFGVLLGGKSMVGFAEQTTQAAIALRNLGEQLGMTPQRLSQYQQTMEALGASQESVNTAFARFGDEIQKFKRGEGSADFLRLLQMLHISPSSILKERPEQIFGDIQKALRQPGIDLQSAESMARALGIPQDAIVAMRSPDWEKRFAAAGKTAYNAEDVKTAEQLNAAWVTMRQNMEALARVILNDVAPVIEKVLDHIKGLAENKEYGQMAAEGLGVLAVGALGIRKVIGSIFGGLFGGAKAAALPAAGVGVGWIGRLLGVGAVTTMAQDTENAYGPGGKPQETFFPHKWILAWNKLFGRAVPNAPDQPSVPNAPDQPGSVGQPYGFDEGQKRWSPLGGASKDIRADVEEPVRKGMLAALREFFGLGRADAATFGEGGDGEGSSGPFRGGLRRGHGGRAGATGIRGGGGSVKGIGGWWTPERQRHAVDRLMNEAGLSASGAAGLVARWSGVEAPGGPTAENNIGGGHYGIGQWSHSRAGKVFGNPDFDTQLGLAIRELNGSESKAANVLRGAKNAAEGSRGASMFERAEHYNPSTGYDDYTFRTPTQKVLDGLNSTSGGTGAPSAANGAGGGAGRPAQGGMRPGSQRFIPPVGVDSSHDPSTPPPPAREMNVDPAPGLPSWMKPDKRWLNVWNGGGNAAPAGVMGLAAGAKLAGVSNSRHTVHNNQSEVAIQSMHIHSSSRDAQELAGDIKPAFDRLALASHSNYSHV